MARKQVENLRSGDQIKEGVTGSRWNRVHQSRENRDGTVTVDTDDERGRIYRPGSIVDTV